MANDYDMHTKNIFSNWGLMNNFDPRTPSYAQITATHSILPERIEYGWT